MYDKSGTYYPDSKGGLWTKSTISKYVRKQTCFIDQYDSYIVEKINMHVNGYQTLTENIADNGGIKASYRVK